MSHLMNANTILQNVASNTTVVVPAGMSILQIIIENTTGNAVVGGVKIGTSSGATDVVAAFAVASSSLTHVSDSVLLKAVFSMTADTTLYIQAVTLWNSASLNIHFVLRSFK
jgi:hypothetical protein